jgi:serine/threonine protein kinase/Tfp pilus assembly protein PilF
MAKKCPKCQSDNPGTATFCADCGTQLPSLEDIQVTETIEAPKEELTRGATFAGRYEIIEELGKGGMGRVYRVEDTKLNQEVALKLIKPEIASDKKTVERFRNELKTARMIAHKNVCRMFDFGESGGSNFITMEYIRGEDLKSLVRKMGQLSAGQALSIAKQVCDGLIEAHNLGIVHRDLKPQNIMIDTNGDARIMDFGIARSLRAKGITGSGVMIGTPEYMSPEQVDGKEADQRADIYSLGVILYEMVTGRVPFEGDTPFSIGVKQKSETPKNPKDLNKQIPDDLNHLILRCLEKDKENRYRSAEEIRSELEYLEQGIVTTERAIVKKELKTVKIGEIKWRNLIVYGGGFILLIVIFLVGFILFTGRQMPIDSIAILPFENISGNPDLDYLSDGITENIIDKLAQLPSIKKVIARSSVFRYKGKEINPQVIGHDLGVEAALISKMYQRGDELSLTVELVNTSDNSRIWGKQYKKNISDIIAIQEDITDSIADNLRLKLTGEEIERLKKRFTQDTEAYKKYLQGRFFLNRRTEEGIEMAIKYFKQAIDIDPNYAMAYAGIADSYSLIGTYSYLRPHEAYPLAKKAALQALEIDNTISEVHTSLAAIFRYYDWDWKEAGKKFKRALELNPNNATTHHWYAFYLTIFARFDEAIKEIKRAQQLDPLSSIINTDIGMILYYARQFDEAEEQCFKTNEIDPNFWKVYLCLGMVYIQKELYNEAIVELEKAIKINPFDQRSLAYLGYAWGMLGRKDQTLKILDELLKQAKEKYVSAVNIATLYISIEEEEEAIAWLEKAYEEHEPLLTFARVRPTFDALRSNTKFKELLEKIDLE